MEIAILVPLMQAETCKVEYYQPEIGRTLQDLHFRVGMCNSEMHSLCIDKYIVGMSRVSIGAVVE